MALADTMGAEEPSGGGLREALRTGPTAGSGVAKTPRQGALPWQCGGSSFWHWVYLTGGVLGLEAGPREDGHAAGKSAGGDGDDKEEVLPSCPAQATDFIRQV